MALLFTHEEILMLLKCQKFLAFYLLK